MTTNMNNQKEESMAYEDILLLDVCRTIEYSINRHPDVFVIASARADDAYGCIFDVDAFNMVKYTANCYEKGGADIENEHTREAIIFGSRMSIAPGKIDPAMEYAIVTSHHPIPIGVDYLKRFFDLLQKYDILSWKSTGDDAFLIHMHMNTYFIVSNVRYQKFRSYMDALAEFYKSI